MARLTLKLLGSYRLALDDVPVEAIESDKGRALLAYLAVECDRPHPREKLVGIFWPEQDEAHARGSLSQALYHLRSALGDRPPTGILPTQSHTQPRDPYLLVSPKEIQLNPKCEYETDVAAFSALMTACKAHGHPQNIHCDDCLKRYQEAVSLYGGAFLDGFYLPQNLAFEEWATILREQLHLQMMAALEQLVTAFERQGELDQALGYARRMVQLDELGEAGNLNVLRLLALLDRRREALAQYATFQQALAIQLGAEPGMEAKLLYQRLRNEETGTNLGNLPASLTPFVGRRQELDELWGLLRDPKSRLMCVFGPGGSGKTRLALEAAKRQQYYFRDGVYFVPLSALGAGSSLLAVIAEGLGFTFRESGEPKKQLLDYLRYKRVLLVLDSFETVVESARLVAELLAASEGSKVLVTSRVWLNLSGEHIFPLNGMHVPPPDADDKMLNYSSVELFLEAAKRIKPGYIPGSLNDVAHICRLVEGMPLSLLLASTWVTDFSSQEIAIQISHSLDFLSVEWADLPERQRSLRATYEYSWNLLSPCEQTVLMSLAVFRNPFSTQAADQVANASPQLLHALVGKCLLGITVDGQYQMHDLVRQYSEEKLAHAYDGQERTVRQRHSNYFLERAAGWNTLFKGPQQAGTLAQADKEIDDVQVAWEWVAQLADVASLSRTSEGLMLYYSLRCRYDEGKSACQFGLEKLKESSQPDNTQLILKGWLLAWQSAFCDGSGEMEQAIRLQAEGQKFMEKAQAVGQDVRRLEALIYALDAGRETDLKVQLDEYLHCAELYKQIDEPWRRAGILTSAGMAAMRQGDHQLGQRLYQEALELSRAVGEPRRLGTILEFLSYEKLTFVKPEIGVQLMNEAADSFRAAGDRRTEANAELHLAVLLGWTGHFAEAHAALESILLLLQQVGDRYGWVYGMVGLGMCELVLGEYVKATRTMQVALESAQLDGFAREEAFIHVHLGCLALVNGDESQVITDIQEGVSSYRHMHFFEELGMALGGLALAQHMFGQEQQAWTTLQEVMHIAVETHGRFTIFTLPAALVVILADTGKWEQAVEAYSAVIKDPIVANSRWFADMVGNRMDLAKQRLPEEVWLAAEARGREGDLFDVLARLGQEISAWGMAPVA